MSAYYNENDPEKCAALEAMMRDGHIAAGRIDDRDIRDVNPAELVRYDQCHFFAGVGLWSAALRKAGVPDDWPIWTGSPPCQPYSTAGRKKAALDDRHLWPALFWLIVECKPSNVLGEQVASKDGLGWLDLVCGDMEGAGYAGGAVDLCSAGFGAPTLLSRLYFGWIRYFVADQDTGLARANSSRLEGSGEVGQSFYSAAGEDEKTDHASNDDGAMLVRKGQRNDRADLYAAQDGFWRDCDWLLCREIDGPAIRPVKSGSCGVASRDSGTAGALRAWGDAINLQVAAEFIRAVKPDLIR